MSKALALSLTLIIGFATATLFKSFYDLFQHEMEMYRAESVCVAKLIPLGIKRKDIKTGNGTCEVIIYEKVLVINPQEYVNYDNN